MSTPTREEICQAFFPCIRLMKKELEILGDPTVNDTKSREIIFAKVSKERLEWSRKVMEQCQQERACGV
ncbi:hypothetical protein [Desulfosarcina cetonica]|uniref:hypothetical protein n=1 Tax=Desulfosarcina cetonica TaxID=90730 RepID=UPI0006CFCC64|nr:hypothetical protein [Desulfosarcina cetonica]